MRREIESYERGYNPNAARNEARFIFKAIALFLTFCLFKLLTGC